MATVNVLPLTVGHREVLLIRAIVINACARFRCLRLAEQT
jgi:hypothetical protein